MGWRWGGSSACVMWVPATSAGWASVTSRDRRTRPDSSEQSPATGRPLPGWQAWTGGGCTHHSGWERLVINGDSSQTSAMWRWRQDWTWHWAWPAPRDTLTDTIVARPLRQEPALCHCHVVVTLYLGVTPWLWLPTSTLKKKERKKTQEAGKLLVNGGEGVCGRGGDNGWCRGDWSNGQGSGGVWGESALPTVILNNCITAVVNML